LWVLVEQKFKVFSWVSFLSVILVILVRVRVRVVLLVRVILVRVRVILVRVRVILVRVVFKVALCLRNGLEKGKRLYDDSVQFLVASAALLRR
jgi:hypothetical protein